MFAQRKTAFLTCALLFAIGPLGWADGFNVSGWVVDVRGEPVAEASAWLSQNRVVRAGTTDAEGRFQFEAADVGPAEVVAWKEGHSLGGAEGQILGPVEFTVQLFEPGEIQMQTITLNGEPISGVRVQRMRIGSQFTVAVSDLVPHGFPSLRSDDEGNLVLTALPVGPNASVSFVLSHRVYANTLMPPIPVGTTNLGVQLLPGAKVGGRVTNSSGEGVGRTRVSVFRPRQEGGQVEFAEVLSGPDGFYAAILPPAGYFVAARHEDYAMPAPQPLVVEEESDSVVVNIELPDRHRIYGKMIDPDGEPVPQVLVQYVSGETLYAEVISDARGDFSVTVASGEGTLYIVPPPSMMTTLYPQIPFSIAEKREINIETIELKPLPLITGKVTMPEAGDLDKVMIATQGIEPPLWTVTDEDGRFEMQLQYMPSSGTVALRAEHAYRFLRSVFTVDLKELEEADVALTPFTPNLMTAGDSALNDLSDLVGKVAPPWECDTWFNVTDNEGNAGTLSLESLRGKVVVLNLWGGFQREGIGLVRLAELNSLQYLFADVDDVVVVGVHDAGTQPPEVALAVREFGIAYPVGRDADPFVTFTRYRAQYIPQTVLIDKDGILRHYDVKGRLLELVKTLRRQPRMNPGQ